MLLSRLNFVYCTCVAMSSAFYLGVVLLVLQTVTRDGVTALRISNSDIENAFRIAEDRLSNWNSRQKRMASEGEISGRPASRAEFIHFMSHSPSRLTRSLQKNQIIFEEATRVLRETHGLSHEEISTELKQLNLRDERSTRVKRQCTTPQIDCSSNDPVYRTPDGSCNNLNNPSWGQSNTCFQRYCPVRYDDGISTMRTATSGQELPNARNLSLSLHTFRNRPTERLTHFHMQWGQFLDHDISLTPASTTVDNQMINCCPVTNDSHPQCAAILSSGFNPTCANSSDSCMSFVRSMPCSSCAMGPRQQQNQVTSFIDASHIYGSDETTASDLRTSDGTGSLRFTNSQYGQLLPQTNDTNDFCSLPPNDICFVAGDIRVNQHPALTCLQTIFLRLHNFLVNYLSSINPQWGEERLYQEARKISGAIMQVITYKEYLVPLLGDERMQFFNLYINSDTTYNSDVNPTLRTEFSTCAFRLHSTVNDFFREVFNVDGDSGHLLRNIFFRPFEAYDGKCESYLEGLIRGNGQKFDRHMGCDVTHHLYEQPAFDGPGLDLAAFNIQRGRDHGLCTYIELVQVCGGPVITSFDDLVNSGLMTSSNVQLLRDQYNDVADIDCFSGCLFERLNRADSIVGPTVRCIVGMQFHNLKYGDRFYFEHTGLVNSFTAAQRRELRKITAARVICDTTSIPTIQRNVFFYSSSNNPEVDCSQIQPVDFSVWQE